MRCIIALAGPSKSGKTTLAKRLATSLGVRIASFGDHVRKEALRRGLSDASHKQLQDLGSELVKTDTRGFCRAVLEDAEFHSDNGLVLDGIRHVDVLAMIRNLVGDRTVKLIYLESSRADRLNRSSLDAHQLQAIDSHPVEADGSLLKSSADLVLDTSVDREKCFEILLQWTLQHCN